MHEPPFPDDCLPAGPDAPGDDDRPPAVPPRAGRRALLRALAVAAPACALTPGTARGASVLAVRVWPAKDYTRVTLELDEPLKFDWFTVPDPHRLVVDLEGVAHDAALRGLVAKIQPNDPWIRQVRAGLNRPGVVRLVLDLKMPSAPQVFKLDPVDRYRWRLVLDLRPAVEPDPLAELIAQQEQRNGAPEAALPAAPGAAARPPAAQAPAAGAPRTSPAPSTQDPIAAIAEEAASRERARPGPRAPGGAPAAPPASPPAVAAAPGDAPFPEEGRNTESVRGGRRPAVSRLVTIALDPGHGGEDPGAIGRAGTQEKDVVLRVARRLRARIDAEPGMRAFLTRDGDYFVPLGERVRKARGVQADLFVSIHADAFVNPEARGASVFALSEQGASSAAARWIAAQENRSDAVGGVSGIRDRQLASVLADLSTTAQIKDSLRLGRAVLEELGGLGRLHKPRVEQAGFAVLKAPDIPSILVETAFISNPEEEARLGDETYQGRLADAILAGIRKYFQRHPPGPKGRPL